MECQDITAGRFARLLGSFRVSEEASTAAGVAMVVADFRAVTGEPPTGLDAVVLPPCVLVALVGPDTDPSWHKLAGRCDVVLEHPDDVDALRGSVLANPLAATALVLLLRGGPARTIEEGLVAESAVYSMLQAGPEFISWRESRARRRRPDEVGPAVRLERHGSVLRLTLDRPHVHNAVNAAVRDALAEGLELALLDPAIEHVVIDGAGPSFSSGGDLDEFGTFPDPATSHLTRLTRSPARMVAHMAAKVEFRLHGACMGAGIELPAFAQRVVATHDARFALPELRYGLVPGAGGTVSVTRRVGRHRSAYLALSGKVIDAATARLWGLVDELDG